MHVNVLIASCKEIYGKVLYYHLVDKCCNFQLLHSQWLSPPWDSEHHPHCGGRSTFFLLKMRVCVIAVFSCGNLYFCSQRRRLLAPAGSRKLQSGRLCTRIPDCCQESCCSPQPCDQGRTRRQTDQQKHFTSNSSRDVILFNNARIIGVYLLSLDPIILVRKKKFISLIMHPEQTLFKKMRNSLLRYVLSPYNGSPAL